MAAGRLGWRGGLTQLEALLFVGLALVYVIYLVVVVPASAVLAFALYGIGMPVAYVRGLARVLVVRSAGLSEPRRRPQPPDDGDPAVLQYFYGPALADADHAVRVAHESCRQFWSYGGRKIRSSFDSDSPLITAPLGAGGAVGMAAGTAVGGLVAAGCALVHLLVVGVSAASVRAAGAVLRGTDSALLRIKNIRMVCPNCYERVPYPGYVCPGPLCTRRHRDVRPGPFGIVRRRCHCGQRMNTLLLFGSSSMAAFCPYCGKPLEHRPGVAQEIVLPFFGAKGAGKTRLMLSMVTQLRQWAEEGKLTADFGDSVTSDELKLALGFLRTGSATAMTSVQLPRANVIRLISRGTTRVLHMFDVAGEFFYSSDRTRQLRYLSKARTFILVIDPLSVDAFWRRLPPDRQAELKPVRSGAPSPELAYQQTHQQIEAMGVRLRRARRAVAFSRADGYEAPASDVAEWARVELGIGNLIRSVRQNFLDACFFHTAAVMEGGQVHESVAALLRWVLAADKVDLPQDTR